MVKYLPHMGNTGTSTWHLWEFLVRVCKAAQALMWPHALCLHRRLPWTLTAGKKSTDASSVSSAVHCPLSARLVKYHLSESAQRLRGASHPVGEALKSWKAPIFLFNQPRQPHPACFEKKKKKLLAFPRCSYMCSSCRFIRCKKLKLIQRPGNKFCCHDGFNVQVLVGAVDSSLVLLSGRWGHFTPTTGGNYLILKSRHG